MRPGRAADHSPPSSAAVMEEYSYTSTHPLGTHRPVIGITLPFTYAFYIANKMFKEIIDNHSGFSNC